MAAPLTHLGSLAVTDFMAGYWQKRPVLLRNALDPWICPVTPDELLAFACRDDADARLILTADDPPELLHGPFEPDELRDLPDEAWTVLVQEMDRLHPGVADMQDQFRFLPNWRLDDVMISYAVPGGGVGAHIDQYDVFLIQGSGRRRWEIGTTPVPDPAWRDDSDVAVLADFTPDASWVLEPGDVLYLPPGIPHNGIALDPCLTLSVGCRAPDTTELLTGVSALAAERVQGAPRYFDPGLQATDDPGRFTEAARAALRERLRAVWSDDKALDRLLGRYVTEPVRGWTGQPPEETLNRTELRERIAAGAALRPAVASQLAYTEAPDGSVTLFVGGEAVDLPSGSAGFARRLTGPGSVTGEDALALVADDGLAGVLTELVNTGAVRVVDP